MDEVYNYTKTRDRIMSIKKKSISNLKRFSRIYPFFVGNWTANASNKRFIRAEYFVEDQEEKKWSRRSPLLIQIDTLNPFTRTASATNFIKRSVGSP